MLYLATTTATQSEREKERMRAIETMSVHSCLVLSNVTQREERT